MTFWEQSEITDNIPIYKIILNIGKALEGVLHVRGDQHLGLNTDHILMEKMYKKEQEKYKNRIVVIDTGDWIENHTKGSIGHGYDTMIQDPNKQKELAIAIQERLDSHLYNNGYKNMRKDNISNMRRIGVIGNHEYRTRKESGQWLNNELYAGRGVIDAGIHCIISLDIISDKGTKNYNIYVAHRLTNSANTISAASLLRSFNKRKADIDADIYVSGHYHRRFIMPDNKYTKEGQIKKVLYVINPSPCRGAEYSTWALYSPTESGFFTNIFLPVDKNKNAYGLV